MEKDKTLESNRKEVREEILALKEKIPSVRILNFFGRAFEKRSLGYWLSNIILLNLVTLSPWIIVGMVLQKEKSLDILLMGILATEAVILGLFLSYFVIHDLFDDIAGPIIEKISSADDVLRLLHWIKKTWAFQNVIPIALVFCLLWVLLGLRSWSIALGGFVGFGFSFTTILVGLLAGVAMYVPFWISLLAFNLNNYQYDVNALSPADSEIIHIISEILIRRIYIIAVYFAIFTLIGSSNWISSQVRVIFSFPILLIAWILITAQFLLTYSTIGKIVNKAKWKTLHKIQIKINYIEATGDLSEKETAERLLRLDDIHARVVSSRTNTLSWKSLSTLVSQLMLPLLGLLLGNLDKLLDLLK